MSEHKHRNLADEFLPADAFQMAMQHQQKGELAQADALYRKILQLEPNHADALHFSGVLAYQAGQYDTAVELISRAIRSNPGFSSMYCNLGLVFQTQGKLDEAINCYYEALSLQPDLIDARNNLGSAFVAKNNIAAAIETYRYLLMLNRDDVQTQNKLAYLQKQKSAVEKQSDNCFKSEEAKAHCELGNSFYQQWKLNQAVESYKKTLAIKLDCIEARQNLGLVYQEQCFLDEAVKCFHFILSFKPDYAAAYYHLGNLSHLQGKLDIAMDHYQKALVLQPDYPEASQRLFNTQMHCCDWSNYFESREKILHSIRAGQHGYKPFQFIVLSKSVSDEHQCAAAYAADKYPISETPLWTGERYQHGKIRIAYISDDFREHPVAYAIAELFERHDESRFEIIGISLNPEDKSVIGQRIKNAFSQYIDVSQMGNYEVAALLREMEVDIAVDLMGLTSYSRTAIFSFRPAPVQVNYLGYPSTMAVEYMDYIIADQQIIPWEQHKDYSEKVVYLPDTFFVTDSKRLITQYTPTRTEQGLPETGFVFCCFNNHYKLNPDTFTVWMRLLSKVENSVLWLNAANAFVIANLSNEAKARGIAPERLIFAQRTKDIADHLARQKLADLFLDTLPYNAHATTSDALWGGLPVLTCMGDTFAGRVAGSLLTAVGLTELITHNPEEYEALAFKLATTPELLSQIREKLARNRTTYPLFNTDRFRKHIEAAYTTMWERYQHGELPDSFAVEPIKG